MEKLISADKAFSEERKIFWEGKIAEYDANYSGRSYRDFCKDQSLDYHQLMYWRKRLQSKKGTSAENKVSFIPLEITSPPVAEKDSRLEFYYGKHYRFVLSGNIKKVVLVNLFKALEESHVDATIRN